MIFVLWIGLSLLVGVVGQNRKIGFGWAFACAIILSPIIGVVIALMSPSLKQLKEAHIFASHQELARKAEYKGQFEQAIDHYQDALYHLENDYQNLTTKDNLNRLSLIQVLKEKVQDLRGKIQ